MDLNEDQKRDVATWVSEGATLSEIQKRLAETFGMSLTYMDVRFLVLDLGLNVQDKVKPTKKPDASVEEADEGGGAEDGGGGDRAAEGELLPGAVSIEVDRVMKPGSLVSGTVKFSDGVSASWALDQMGRLALDAGSPEYRPSQEDIQAFQEELRAALEKRGF